MLRKPWLWSGLFVLMLLAGLLVTTPLSILNHWFFPHLRLVNPEGNLSIGHWQGIAGTHSDYPLSCHYQRIKGLTYQLQCHTPIEIKATFTLQGFKDWSVTELSSVGQVEALRPLLPKGLPGNLTGKFNLMIDKATVKNGQLSYLSLQGDGQQFAWSNRITFATVSLTTLTDTQPIRLLLSAHSEPQGTTADGMIPLTHQEKTALSIQAELTGNQYQLSGEVRGQALAPYQGFLKTFAKQTQDNVYAVYWQGLLF